MDPDAGGSSEPWLKRFSVPRVWEECRVPSDRTGKWESMHCVCFVQMDNESAQYSELVPGIRLFSLEIARASGMNGHRA